MGERNVIVRDIIEEMNFFFLQEQRSSNRVNGGITPALVEETTIFVKGVKVIGVGLRSEPIQVTNFEVGPL